MITEEEAEEENVIKDARSRQFYYPSKKMFNYTKRRATDLEENKSVKLPKQLMRKCKVSWQY